MVLSYIQCSPSALFQQHNARPHVAHNVQEFFFTHQIELLPWPACSLDLSPIEYMWSMLAQQLARNTPPVVTSDQLSNPRLIEDETFNDSDITNNLVDYEDGQEEPDSLRADKNMQGSSLPTNWKNIFLK
ncbi:transposable element Tcb1 transposase [Trichonephila clavipes]|nr:transposable element Tcb1 transposase [Trichonephila clavipes]